MTLPNGTRRTVDTRTDVLRFRTQNKSAYYRSVVEWTDYLLSQMRGLGGTFGEEELWLAPAMEELKRARKRIADRAALLAKLEETGLLNG